LDCRVEGLGCRVKDVGLRELGQEFRCRDLGFWIKDKIFRI
jgi:hypothetical protein